MRRPTATIGLIFLLLFLPVLPLKAADLGVLLARIDAPHIADRFSEMLHSAPPIAIVEEVVSRPEPPTQRVRIIEADDSLTALNFTKSSFFSPYIGAGIGQEEPPIHDPAQPQILTLRLGAGFGCNLDSLTRLFFNYSFQFLPDSSLDTNPHLDDAHHITLGLQISF